MVIINKIDQVKSKSKTNKVDLVISAEKDNNLKKLKDSIWEKLDFVRVYLVRPGETPSKDNPVIMKVGQSLSGVAAMVGKEFAEDKTKARIWGAGAKHPGQEVSLKKKIEEGMQVRFV